MPDALVGLLFFCLVGLAFTTFCLTAGRILVPIAEILSDIIILVLSLPVLLVVWLFEKVKEALNGKD